MADAIKNTLSPVHDTGAPGGRTDTPATVLQRRAAHPAGSSWVGASAGAGKTKVLTDRIVRLLLPQEDGQDGTPPHKILALTFTKAAASEMAARVRARLSGWAVMEEDKLCADLRALLGRDAGPEERLAARRLFAAVVDAPGGIQIMTIHSFCQSVLGRFPLEAGVPPDFRLIEDAAQRTLMDEARRTALEQAERDPSAPLALALGRLMPRLDEDGLTGLLYAVQKEQGQLARLQRAGLPLYERLCQSLGVRPGADRDSLLAEFCAPGRTDEDKLRNCARLMDEYGPKKNQQKAFAMLDWLAGDADTRIQSYDAYRGAYLTKDGAPFARPVDNQKLLDAHPDLPDTLAEEAAALVRLEEDMAAAECARLTADLFVLTGEILGAYAALKARRGLLDFDDLILKTLDLLEGRSMNRAAGDATAWVMYKLDQGIDHILVDEAQDTNPEQWDIIRALAGDFFAGEGQKEQKTRTLFVVGDEKQSIFSFQRAAPEKFREMEAYFADKIAQSGQKFESIPISISFRSTRAVLQTVDATFDDAALRTALGGRVEAHTAHRGGQPGTVELWPVFETPKEEDEADPLAPPLTIRESASGSAKLATEIAATVKGWITNREILPSHGRPISAGDIMVLVRTRNAFVGQLVRALKLAGIPVSGVDRMVLQEQIAVQDILSAMRFALLPSDDLSLAELLKSPLAGWDDDALMRLAIPRAPGQSLWGALQQSDAAEGVLGWLRNLVRIAGSATAYEFCAAILAGPCPADPRSGLRAMTGRLGHEALDPLEELQNAALTFDQTKGLGLQLFLQQFIGGSGEIKRQMEEGGNAVRIMTVHASKGLQAPIVFLPDTAKSAQGGRSKDMLFWPERTGLALPYFVPSADLAVRDAGAAKQRYEAQAQQEYARLLYVAMTRAEDRLYVAAHQGTRGMQEDSWHKAVSAGFARLAGVEQAGDKLRYSSPASDAPDRSKKGGQDAQQIPPAPAWMLRPPPAESRPPRPLVPSRPSESEADVPALSPLKALDQARFRRGNITHKLLQVLPSLPVDRRAESMARYLASPAHQLSRELQQDIAREIGAILADPALAALFGPDSLAEVPVTGLLDDHTIISGQIDRLVVTGDEAIIIDYKTNRPPPAELKDVPRAYVNQMAAYRRALARIYPQHKIRTLLLWTMEARVMEMPAAD